MPHRDQSSDFLRPSLQRLQSGEAATACLRGLAVVIRQLSPGQGQLHLRIGVDMGHGA